jgi:hypothetical protein
MYDVPATATADEDIEMRGPSVTFAGAAALSAALAAAAAAADDYDILRSECAKQLGLSPAGCDCIAETARSDLSDQERGFVVAQVTGQQEQAASLQQDMNGDSMMKAMNFLATTPQKCAGQ